MMHIYFKMLSFIIDIIVKRTERNYIYHQRQWPLALA